MDFIGCSQLAARLSTIAVDSVEALASECYRVPSANRLGIRLMSGFLTVASFPAVEPDKRGSLGTWTVKTSAALS